MSESAAKTIAIDRLIKPWEGLALQAYWDNIGECWTIGYGHTDGVEQHLTCTQEQADGWLSSDVNVALVTVAHDVQVTLSEDQFAALISFEYNTGAGAASGVFEAINRNDFDLGLEYLRRWVHDKNGNVVPGLVARREAERKLFLGLDE